MADVLIKINCIVKGFQECPFIVDIGEEFQAFKKYGPKGRAMKVMCTRGQLGHLQKELVSPLWAFKENIKCTITGAPFDDPKGRWRIGGGINVPVEVEITTNKSKAMQLKRELLILGIRATIAECHNLLPTVYDK